MKASQAKGIGVDKNLIDTHQRHTGFIAFCETNLCYEKGLNAWILLGPYLLGALGLEMIIEARHMGFAPTLASWIGFLAYLILFPAAWQWILKRLRSGKPRT